MAMSEMSLQAEEALAPGRPSLRRKDRMVCATKPRAPASTVKREAFQGLTLSALMASQRGR